MNRLAEIARLKIKTDCQFYNNNNECNALRMLYCKNEKCSFYKRKEVTDK